MRALLPALPAASFVAFAAAAVLATAPQAPQPVFRSGADLVRFDVRVTDAAGRPITDLRQDEVEIVEDGAARPILLFQHLAGTPGMYAEAARRSVSAEVSSNAGAPRGHLYILVFDQAHIAPGNEQVARRAAEAFIRNRVRPSDRIAVVGLPGPGPELGFTADRTRAIAEVAKVHGDLQRNVKSAAGNLSVHEAYEIAGGNDKVVADVLARQSADLTADVGAASAGMSGVADRGARTGQSEEPGVMRRIILENARTVVAQADASARDTLQRLADLIAQYRSVEGRKSVVLFSEGFHQHNVSRELEQVAAAAAQSYAVFYAFDLNRRAGTDIAQPLAPSTTAATEVLARTEPLGSLAVETDGALILDASSHLDAALARIADQAEDYYLVGFTPSAAALAARGDYRRVSVRVKRPGARAAARTGYATLKSTAPPDRRLAIDAVLAAPFAQQGLRIDYTTYTLRSDNAGRARVLLSLEAHLPVRDAHQAADVVFIVRDARNGRVVASGTDTMPLPSSAEEASATGVGTYRVHFELPPGAYLMRTVVREPGGLVGSADRKLDVRGLSGPDVTVGDLILGSVTGSLPVRARAYAEDGLTGLVEAYGRSPEQLQTLIVSAAIVAVGTEQPVATLRADLGDTMSTGTGVTRRATFSVPLGGVPPGPYQARVKVTAGSETVADLTRELEIVEGSRPLLPPPAPESLPLGGAAAPMRPEDVLGGDFVRAARAALRGSTDSAAMRATQGFDLFARADYGSAAAALGEALRLDQSNAAVAFVLGWAYKEAGDARQAIGAWRAAATIDPKMVPAHLALADGYMRLSERALAEQAIRAGLAAMPASPELQAKLAQIQGKS